MPWQGNPYMVGKMDTGGLLEGIGKVGADYRENQDREKFQKRVGDAFDSGNYKDIQKVMIEYPEARQVFKDLAGFKSDETRSVYGNQLSAVTTSMEDIMDETGGFLDPNTDARTQDAVFDLDQQLQKAGDEITAMGGSPSHINEARQMLADGDLKGAYSQARMGLMMGSPDVYEDRYGDATKDNTKYGAGRTIVKDKSGDQFYATEVREGGQTRTVYSPLGDTKGDKPDGKVEIVGGYGETGMERMTRDLRTDKEKRHEARNISNSQSASKAYEVVMQNSQLYDEAIQAVEDGATTEWWSQYIPSMKASSAELDRVRNQLALNQLSLVSMGALSEKELQVLQQTAIPSMPAEDQKEWLRQKRDATIKYAEFLQEASLAYESGESKPHFAKRKREEAEFNARAKRNAVDSSGIDGVTVTEIK